MAAPDQEVERFGIVWAGWMGGWVVGSGVATAAVPINDEAVGGGRLPHCFIC